MPNANTLAATPLIPGAAQGASSTSEFEFKNSAGNNAELTVGPYLNKRRVRVVAGGRVTGGTTTNFTAKLYIGTALGASVFTTGAIAVNSVSGNWEISAEGVIDSTSTKFQGLANGNVNATAVATANFSVTADPTAALIFDASGTFSASNANNAAFLDYLEVEVL